MCFDYEMGLFYSCFGPSHYLQIAHFKIPRHVCFMVDFPKTASGKIQKFKLQKMVLEEGSLETG
jgi:acyl-coenzyme A synthetase/AMP-(fatty) acid ligase